MEKITATATGTSVHGNHNNIHMANIHKEQTYEAGASDRYPDIIKILIQSKIPGIEDFFITVNKNSSMEDAKVLILLRFCTVDVILEISEIHFISFTRRTGQRAFPEYTYSMQWKSCIGFYRQNYKILSLRRSIINSSYIYSICTSEQPTSSSTVCSKTTSRYFRRPSHNLQNKTKKIFQSTSFTSLYWLKFPKIPSYACITFTITKY